MNFFYKEPKRWAFALQIYFFKYTFFVALNNWPNLMFTK
nr:deoxynucleoside kinase [Listeria fleischmannii]